MHTYICFTIRFVDFLFLIFVHELLESTLWSKQIKEKNKKKKNLKDHDIIRTYNTGKWKIISIK